MHSGLFGGIVHNPAQALAELIAGMHDRKGKVTLPGFYDKVRKLSKKEHKDFARLPLKKKTYLQQTTVPALWGEPEFTPPERLGARPTLEVNGLLSGFTGHRLQDGPTGLGHGEDLVQAGAGSDAQRYCQADEQVSQGECAEGYYVEIEVPARRGRGAGQQRQRGVKAMSKAMKTVWKKPPYFLREGGSIGVVEQLQKRLDVDFVLSGFGLPDCDAHSPNEKLHLPTWEKGIEALIHFFYNLA